MSIKGEEISGAQQHKIRMGMVGGGRRDHCLGIGLDQILMVCAAAKPHFHAPLGVLRGGRERSDISPDRPLYDAEQNRLLPFAFSGERWILVVL